MHQYIQYRSRESDVGQIDVACMVPNDNGFTWKVGAITDKSENVALLQHGNGRHRKASTIGFRIIGILQTYRRVTNSESGVVRVVVVVVVVRVVVD
jgi:hypothetical protein